ncbi:MAG: hypothetical protein PHX83_13600 [Acidobacteriia bacterium]|nr:hypothetical protein [Terriglobia bacterium]
MIRNHGFFRWGIFIGALFILSGSLLPAAEGEKVVWDTMKRFSISIPTNWVSSENTEANTMTLGGDDVVVVLSILYRGNGLEELHRRIALPVAYRAVEGPPKKQKVKFEKIRVGDAKALETDYDIKGGTDDKFSKYHVRVITIDGEKHKFSILINIPLEHVKKASLEERLNKLVDSFKEAE